MPFWWIQINEGEKIDEYLDLARELKMRVTVLSIVFSALAMVPESLEKKLKAWEVRGRIETIPTTALLRWDRILQKSLGDLKRLAVIQTPVKYHQLTLV